MGGRGGLDHPLQRDVGAPVRDVGAHRVVEEHGLLRDQADLPTQGLQRDLAEVEAVDGEASRGGVVEAGQQAGQRGLARSRAPHQRHHLAASERQVHVREHGRPVVGEADTLEADRLAERRQKGRAGTVRDLGLAVHHGEDAGGRRQRVLQLHIELVQAPHRHVEEPEPHQDDEEAPPVERAGGDAPAREIEDAGPRGGAHQLHHRRRHGRGPRRLEVRLAAAFPAPRGSGRSRTAPCRSSARRAAPATDSVSRPAASAMLSCARVEARRSLRPSRTMGQARTRQDHHGRPAPQRQSCSTTSTSRKGTMADTRTASARTLVMMRWICCDVRQDAREDRARGVGLEEPGRLVGHRRVEVGAQVAHHHGARLRHEVLPEIENSPRTKKMATIRSGTCT